MVGAFEPAMLIAMSLGENIGIVTVLPNVVQMRRSLARRYTPSRTTYMRPPAKERSA